MHTETKSAKPVRNEGQPCNLFNKNCGHSFAKYAYHPPALSFLTHKIYVYA